MTSHSSSTTGSANISDRVSGLIRKEVETRSEERIARVERLRARIDDMAARGFIKRQEFSAPTTGDFERLIVCSQKANKAQQSNPLPAE